MLLDLLTYLCGCKTNDPLYHLGYTATVVIRCGNFMVMSRRVYVCTMYDTMILHYAAAASAVLLYNNASAWGGGGGSAPMITMM